MTTARRRLDRHPTGAQIRAARGLLNMSVLDLSERTGLAVNTIKRAESTNDFAPINRANANLLLTTLEAAGVHFIPTDGDLGAGVRLMNPDQAPLARRRTQSGAESPKD